jgi:hypothetical protein
MHHIDSGLDTKAELTICTPDDGHIGTRNMLSQ